MFHKTRSAAKRLLAYALYYSGALWLLAAIRLRNEAVVLMYHRVLPPEADTFSAESIVVRPCTFARHMMFLQKHFRVLSLQVIRQHFAEGSPLPSRSCVVTFDDGWSDNFTYALPILRDRGLPAVFFVATDYIGTTRCFWQERLSRKLFRAAQDESTQDLVESMLGVKIDKPTPERLRSMIREAVSRMKDWRPEAIEAAISDLESALGTSGTRSGQSGDDRFMSWMEVAELERQAACSIGGHGCSHTPMTQLSDEQVERELLECRHTIEARLNHPVEAVAYPNGNFDERTISIARIAGFNVGFTTLRGSVAANDDPMKIRRINIHDAATRTAPEFLCTLLGVFRAYQPRN